MNEWGAQRGGTPGPSREVQCTARAASMASVGAAIRGGHPAWQQGDRPRRKVGCTTRGGCEPCRRSGGHDHRRSNGASNKGAWGGRCQGSREESQAFRANKELRYRVPANSSESPSGREWRDGCVRHRQSGRRPVRARTADRTAATGPRLEPACRDRATAASGPLERGGLTDSTGAAPGLCSDQAETRRLSGCRKVGRRIRVDRQPVEHLRPTDRCGGLQGLTRGREALVRRVGARNTGRTSRRRALEPGRRFRWVEDRGSEDDLGQLRLGRAARPHHHWCGPHR